MSERTIMLPNPAHPIAVEPSASRIVIRVGGRSIAESKSSLTLREASYPAVHYIPRADVDMAALKRSTHTSYCPYKGEANYFSVDSDGGRSTNVAWSYENPFPAMAAIKDHLAFYPDCVDSITEQPADPAAAG